MKSKNKKKQEIKENGSKKANKKHAGENDACRVTGIKYLLKKKKKSGVLREHVVKVNGMKVRKRTQLD